MASPTSTSRAGWAKSALKFPKAGSSLRISGVVRPCAPSRRQELGEYDGVHGLDGLPMGTRPGQLDAGIVLYLMSEKGMSAKAIQLFLYNECGLKGLSGISNDVQERCWRARIHGQSWPWITSSIELRFTRACSQPR